MMIKIILLFSFIFSLPVYSKTKAYFPITGEQAIVNMKTKSFMEEDDPSPKKLYQGMNVAPENSIGGVGKKIKAQNDNLSVICADQGKGQFFCNIVAKKSNICNVSKIKKSVVCIINGNEAMSMYDKFYYNNGEYFYQNKSGELSIQSLPNQFVLKYTEWK